MLDENFQLNTSSTFVQSNQKLTEGAQDDSTKGKLESMRGLEEHLRRLLDADESNQKDNAAHQGQESSRRLGKYQIEKLLACRGQGVVLLAVDPDLMRKVVIKLYPKHVDERQVAAIIREARSMCRLNCSQVAICYSVETTDEGFPYLVMEHVSGVSLAEEHSERSFSADEIREIMKQITEGVEAAHQLGIVHGDLKPNNVMIDNKGNVKLIDFGMAVLYSDEISGRVSGTLAFLPPEKLVSPKSGFDVRGDIFGIGGILYFLLTGKPPFSGATKDEVLRKAALGKIVPICELNPRAPKSLAQIAISCLAPEPSGRYRSATEVRQAFENCRSHPTRSNYVIVTFLLGLMMFAWWAWSAGIFKRFDPNSRHVKLMPFSNNKDSDTGHRPKIQVQPVWGPIVEGQVLELSVSAPMDCFIGLFNARRTSEREWHLESIDPRPDERMRFLQAGGFFKTHLTAERVDVDREELLICAVPAEIDMESLRKKLHTVLSQSSGSLTEQKPVKRGLKRAIVGEHLVLIQIPLNILPGNIDHQPVKNAMIDPHSSFDANPHSNPEPQLLAEAFQILAQHGSESALKFLETNMLVGGSEISHAGPELEQILPLGRVDRKQNPEFLRQITIPRLGWIAEIAESLGDWKRAEIYRQAVVTLLRETSGNPEGFCLRAIEELRMVQEIQTLNPEQQAAFRMARQARLNHEALEQVEPDQTSQTLEGLFDEHRMVLDLCERELADFPLLTLDILDNSLYLNNNLGQKPLVGQHSRVLKGYQEFFQHPHSDVAHAASALGFVYYRLGNWTASREHYRLAIQIFEECGERLSRSAVECRRNYLAACVNDQVFDEVSLAAQEYQEVLKEVVKGGLISIERANLLETLALAQQCKASFLEKRYSDASRFADEIRSRLNASRSGLGCRLPLSEEAALLLQIARGYVVSQPENVAQLLAEMPALAQSLAPENPHLAFELMMGTQGILIAANQIEQANKAFESARALSSRHKLHISDSQLIDYLLDQVQLAIKCENWSSVDVILQHCCQLTETCEPDHATKFEINRLQGWRALEKGDVGQAREHFEAARQLLAQQEADPAALLNSPQRSIYWRDKELEIFRGLFETTQEEDVEPLVIELAQARIRAHQRYREQANFLPVLNRGEETGYPESETQKKIANSIHKAQEFAAREWHSQIRLTKGQFGEELFESMLSADRSLLNELVQRHLSQSASNIAGSADAKVTMAEMSLSSKGIPSETVLVNILKTPCGVEAGQTSYMAIVCRAGEDVAGQSPVVTVDLGEGRLIDSTAASWLAQLAGEMAVALANPASSPEAELHRLVWSPIEPLVSHAKNIILIADGGLSHVPWGALRGRESNPFLAQQFRLISAADMSLFLAPERDLTDFFTFQDMNRFVVVGNLDYGRDQVNRDHGSFTRKGTFVELGPLYAAEREISFLQASGNQCVLLQGAGIDHLAIHGSLEGCQLLHVATHGLAFDEQDFDWFRLRGDRGVLDQERLRLVTPFAFSGLALSRFNELASAGRGTEGILTGEQVLTWDLNDCRLVVLGACQTSYGPQIRGEGAASLQKAFCLAGANWVLANLLPVSDDSAAEFLEEFYCNQLVQRLPILDAFRSAQVEMISRGHPPADWAGWSLCVGTDQRPAGH